MEVSYKKNPEGNQFFCAFDFRISDVKTEVVTEISNKHHNLLNSSIKKTIFSDHKKKKKYLHTKDKRNSAH